MSSRLSLFIAGIVVGGLFSFLITRPTTTAEAQKPETHIEAGNQTTGELKAVTDPITALVAKLSATKHGHWLNGIYPAVNLPWNASEEEVVAEVFKVTGFDQGHVKQLEVEIRQVNIPGGESENYTAVLLTTDLGKKIVLLQYLKHGWWSRVYDAE